MYCDKGLSNNFLIVFFVCVFRLNDDSVAVREASIITITHLILHDFIRVKSLISDAAKCIADAEKTVADVAKYLFKELSKKVSSLFPELPLNQEKLGNLKIVREICRKTWEFENKQGNL